MAIEPSIFAVLNQAGVIVGTGFLVSEQLGVTCAHVIGIAEAVEGDTIQVKFSGKTEKINTQVIPEFWRDVDKGDVAILKLDSVPASVNPFRLAPAADCRPGSDFRSFGYAIAADVQGIHVNGKIDGYLSQHNLLQLQSPQANHGISGAPVFDEKRSVVVGMITKGHTELGRNELTTFATPAEIIWKICPKLKPIISPLPRRNPIVKGINLLPYDYDQRIQNFVTEYIGTDSHPVPFGGRDNALHMLDNWMAETTPYLLLAAPAGRGKSALLVRWLDSLKAREDLALAFVPVSIRFGTNMERVFYAALAARLAYLHGDDIPASPETSTAVYRGLVADYLSKPLANGRTLLVVLDGLDEAADWRIKADFMPAELPIGVRVVVSARFLAGDADSTPWLRRLNWEHSGLIFAPSLVPLDRAGVADVLLKMSCPLDELSRNVDIVTELYRMSEGDPLLVGLYVGDLWAKGEEVSRLKPEDLAGIQPGYDGYFDRWWEDQKELWGKDKPWREQHVRAVRSLLAGALGPLYRNDIQSLDPELASDDIAEALDFLNRFIIGDNKTQGYTFSHPKLGQYFWEALTETEQSQWEQRFLDWGEKTLQELIDGKRNATKKKEIPFYVVTNYGAHLAQAKQPIEKWLPLIHNQEWAQAWFTIEGAYGGYLQDVQWVWGQCKSLDRQAVETNGKVPYLGKQIRCALIQASLHSLAANITAELIQRLVKIDLWTMPQTWAFIRQMSDSDQQCQAITLLIPHLDNKQLPDALETAREIKDGGSRGNVLSILALYLPTLADEALEAVQAIKDEGARARALSILAQFDPSAASKALEAAGAIKDEKYRADILIYLAQHLPQSSLWQVLETVRAMPYDQKRADLLIAKAHSISGTEVAAMMIRIKASRYFNRARVLSVLAQRLPEAMGDALDAAQAIQDEGDRANVLNALAQQLPERVVEGGLEIPQTTQSQDDRAHMLSDPHKRLLELTREELAVTQLIQDADDSARMLSTLVLCLPENLGQMLETVRAIKNERYRASVLSTLAQHLPEGDLRQVLETARTIQNEYERVKVLSTLAHRLSDVTDEALEAARVTKNEEKRVKVLGILSQFLPERVLMQALEMAQTIQNEDERVQVLRILSQRLPEEELQQVLELVQAIQNEVSRASMLRILSQRLPEKELWQVLEMGQTIQDEGERAHVLLSILSRPLPKEVLEKLLEIVRMIQNKVIRAQMLSMLTQHLPELTGEVLVMVRAISDIFDVRTELLITLAGILPEEKLGQVLETAQAIQDESRCASVLSVLAQRLPESELGRVLNTVRAFRNKYAQVTVLSALVLRLPEVTKEVLAMTSNRGDVLQNLAKNLPEGELEQVLESAQTINNEESRAGVLSTLAQRLPEEKLEQVMYVTQAIQDEKYRVRVLIALLQHLPIRSLGQVLVAAQAIQNEVSRANILSALAKRLPEETVEQVLAVAQAIQAKGSRASVLSALVQPLINIPNNLYYQTLEMTLGKLALRKRSDLFSDISALLPVLVHLGTDDAPHEIYEAVRDVTTWWP